MKLQHAVLLIVGLWVLASSPILADVWVEPFPLGSDISGDGTEINPYATISFAYTQITTQGETIRAKPGEYFDVISAFGRIVEVGPVSGRRVLDR